MIPRSFAVEAGPRILQLDTGHQDAGADIDLRVTTGAVAPAGPSGDCAFDRVRLSLTWTAAVTLTITPILDGEDLDETHILALDAQAARASKVYELVLRRVSTSGRSYGVRGTWLALRIEGTMADGDLFIDPAVLEYEVLTPSQTRSST